MKEFFKIYTTTWWKPLSVFLIFYMVSIVGLYYELYWLWGSFVLCFLLHLFINVYSFVNLVVTNQLAEAFFVLLIATPLTVYYLLVMANFTP